MLMQEMWEGVTWLSERLKISLCEGGRLKDTQQNLKCEERGHQTCFVLKTEDLATKPED